MNLKRNSLTTMPVKSIQTVKAVVKPARRMIVVSILFTNHTLKLELELRIDGSITDSVEFMVS
jgi:hypothetical protein